VQKLVLRHGACAQVRAADDSGCVVSFCVQQAGNALSVDRYGFESLGSVPLADVLKKAPRGGTWVHGGADSRAAELKPGETLTARLDDAYCDALLHVDSVSP
jgi:hypothetical protein